MMIRNKRRTLQKRWDLLHKLEDHDLVHAIMEDRWERLLEVGGVKNDGVMWEEKVEAMKEELESDLGQAPVIPAERFADPEAVPEPQRGSSTPSASFHPDFAISAAAARPVATVLVFPE
ncbi:hypothetical protein YB2330_005954 [Saitoella coloradoensis]